MGKKIIVVCEVCGKELIRWKRYNGKINRHFCREHLLIFYKDHLKTQSRKGKKHTQEFKDFMSRRLKGKHLSEKHKIKISETHLARRHLHPHWKGGIYDDIAKWTRDRRHLLGISKKHICRYGGTRIPTKYYRQKRKALVKGGGKLTIQTIQQVYEDNIKKYGTLTCIYCLNPIEFGKDTLEHKQPLSRGGINLYENLAIACRKCNSSKGKKTEGEYRKEILNHVGQIN